LFPKFEELLVCFHEPLLLGRRQREEHARQQRLREQQQARDIGWLERAYQRREPGLLSNLALHPGYKPYYSDPRFVALCQKIGMAAPNFDGGFPTGTNALATASGSEQ